MILLFLLFYKKQGWYIFRKKNIHFIIQIIG